MRLTALAQCILHQSLAQQGKSLLVVSACFVGICFFENFRAEHGIVNARHECAVCRQRIWNG